jgi:hypothetical protein
MISLVTSLNFFRSLSEMEPSGVSVEVAKSCTNKDHCQGRVDVGCRQAVAFLDHGPRLPPSHAPHHPGAPKIVVLAYVINLTWARGTLVGLEGFHAGLERW